MSSKMTKGTTIRMWRRSLVVLMSLLVLGFGVIVLRLIKLQLVDGKNLQQGAVAQQLKDTKLNAKRGTIYDCNMKPLAQSATVWTVVLEPAYLKDDQDKKIVADGLSQILEIDRNELYEKTKQKSYYTIIKKKIESDIKDKIIEFKKEKNISSGIRLIEDYKRYYPYGSFASSVIGVSGADNQGLFGIENYYNKELTGDPGRLVTAKNAIGTDMPFDYEQKIDARNGYNLVLSIDEVIQHFLEKNLEEGIINNKVENRATAIMMDVNTGEILGMAVKNDFDLNDPFKIVDGKVEDEISKLPEEEKSKARSQALEKQWRNKAVSDVYIPGSVFKIITASMALEENVINEDTKFNCTGSITPIAGDRTVKCHKHSGHGSQNFIQALCNSCNPAFVNIGQMLGAERFYKYYSSFGFTKKTGIDLPGEAEGYFFSKDGSMKPMDLVVASFGQNFSITPIQMIVAAASVANGGTLVHPHIVKQIVDDNGNIIKSIGANKKRQVISRETAKRMCSILQTNATIGTGKNGYVAGYRICGKTGTSEKKGDGAKEGDYIASYCGFAPADNPQIALLVFYDTPKGGSYYGSAVAAPTFARVMEDTLQYLGIEKIYTDEEASKLDIATPFLIGSKVNDAKNVLLNLGLEPIIKGGGDTVVFQIPEVSSKIPKGGKILLYTDKESSDEKVSVPNLLGMTISEANRVASSVGINLSVIGPNSSESISNKQSIAEGENVTKGSVITVEFIQKDNVQ